ncbi:MAG: glycosyltransferase [Ruminococcus sp.]|nr:glycosyltransferase [Candidatus Copronaster equi]
MKNILIVSHGMEIGGAERALLGLLGAIDYSKYNVELFLLRHVGELMKFIPKEVKILPENKKYASLAVPFSTVIKNKAPLVGLGRYIGNKKADKFGKKNNLTDASAVFINYSHKYTKAFMPEISDKEYDLAVSFLTPHYFVAEKVKAKKKIAWVHTDYSYVPIDEKSELEMYSQFDKIITVSETVAETFFNLFPSLESKIETIYNIHPAEFIKAQSEEFSVKDEMPDDGYVKFLSVGRFCDAKNFDNVPDICSRLDNVKWYIIGFGGDEELIKQKIKEADMTERVILLGKKENPYPYFRECDFYIQPSRYEGNAVTVNEALILGKKTAIAKYATSSAQINNGVDGVIVPQDNAGCADGLNAFVADKALQKKILDYVNSTDFSRSEEIKKLYTILGD